jgi:hypothetical protein
VSLLSRKTPVDHSLTGQAKVAAGQAKMAAMQAKMAAMQAVNATSNAAQQSVPLAKNASASVKQGTDSAVAWATPYADAARNWVAPRLEQSAQAINESIAPKISDALLTAADKIDVSQRKPRHRYGKIALIAASMLVTVAGAFALMSMRNKQQGDDDSFGAMPMPAPDESIPGDGQGGDYPDAEGDGQHIV